MRLPHRKAAGWGRGSGAVLNLEMGGGREETLPLAFGESREPAGGGRAGIMPLAFGESQGLLPHTLTKWAIGRAGIMPLAFGESQGLLPSTLPPQAGLSPRAPFPGPTPPPNASGKIPSRP